MQPDHVRVYRVEMPSGEGPFGTTVYYDLELVAAMDHDLARGGMETHPVPEMDGIKDFERDHTQCGCVSLDQLYTWFSLDTISLLNERDGFDVYVFECPKDKVWIGRHQCVFHRPSAKRLGRLNEVEHAT